MHLIGFQLMVKLYGIDLLRERITVDGAAQRRQLFTATICSNWDGHWDGAAALGAGSGSLALK